MSALSGLLGDYMLSRRHFAITGTAFAAVVVARHASGYAAGNSFDELANTLAVLERESGGRLGVAVLDTKTGRNAAYRDTELFPLARPFST
jgi:beta-lactamase class A